MPRHQACKRAHHFKLGFDQLDNEREKIDMIVGSFNTTSRQRRITPRHAPVRLVSVCPHVHSLTADKES
jgi:hypothetical protein